LLIDNYSRSKKAGGVERLSIHGFARCVSPHCLLTKVPATNRTFLVGENLHLMTQYVNAVVPAQNDVRRSSDLIATIEAFENMSYEMQLPNSPA
jgi:hypothetical protein